MFYPALTPVEFQESQHPIVRVDAIAKVSRNKVLPIELSGKQVFHYSIPNVQDIGTGKIEDGGTIDSDKWLITEEAVLISKLNPRKSTICLATPQENVTVTSTEFVVLSAGNSIDNRYLKYVLESEIVRQFLSSRTTSATRSHQRVNPHDITALGIPWPEASKRAKAVEKLDSELAEIDDFIADQQHILELEVERFKSAITSLVHPEPIKDIFNSSLNSVEWNGTTWRCTHLGMVTKVNEGLVDPREEPYSSMTLIAPNHVESGTGKILYTETATEQGADSGKYLVNKGQVIFSKIRPTLLKSTIAPEDCLCSADMYGISVNSDYLTNEFLMWFLLSKPFETFAKLNSDRVAMPKLNRETLSSTPTWIPELEFQKTLKFKSNFDIFDLNKNQIRESINLLQTKKKSSLHHILTQ